MAARCGRGHSSRGVEILCHWLQSSGGGWAKIDRPSRGTRHWMRNEPVALNVRRCWSVVRACVDVASVSLIQYKVWRVSVYRRPRGYLIVTACVTRTVVENLVVCVRLYGPPANLAAYLDGPVGTFTFRAGLAHVPIGPNFPSIQHSTHNIGLFLLPSKSARIIIFTVIWNQQ